MNDYQMMKLLDVLENDTEKVSDAEVLIEGEEVKEPDSIEKDDEQIEELLFLQEMKDESTKYNSIEEKYEEKLILDEVEKMVSKYMERSNKRP